jgi:hypothetical protein
LIAAYRRYQLLPVVESSRGALGHRGLFVFTLLLRRPIAQGRFPIVVPRSLVPDGAGLTRTSAQLAGSGKFPHAHAAARHR